MLRSSCFYIRSLNKISIILTYPVYEADHRVTTFENKYRFSSMKSKSIDKEVDELNRKFEQLQSNYNTLREDFSSEHLRLRERLCHLEKKNAVQEKRLAVLKRIKKPIPLPTEGIITNSTPVTGESFSEGDIVKVINNHKGQYGSIGKIYRITKKQVHFTDIKTGTSITRAFKNVQLLILSHKEKSNLLNQSYDDRGTR